MPMFLLMRHGQSQADLEDRLEGRADYPLTDLGRRQARLAADWLALHWQPTLVFSSPLQRAAQTAHLIADPLGLPVTLDPDLQEWSKGMLDGMLRQEANRKYPPPEKARTLDEPIQDGESARQVYARAARFWAHLTAGCAPNARLLIVTHGGLLNMLYRVFLNIPLTDDLLAFSTIDTGMHLWEIRAGRHIVHWANRHEHLLQSLQF
ncbi:MAG: histidine phosphatase family protein [Anaerolineales bacterium]